MGEKEDQPAQEERREQEAKARVDEAWKKSVEEERERLREEARERQAQGQPAEGELPEADFRIFLAGLYTQTLVALGEVDSPLSQKKEQNLREAQYLIDTISMLKDKTEGNLTKDEESYLDGLLHDLRMRYVGAVSQPTPPRQEQ